MDFIDLLLYNQIKDKDPKQQTIILSKILLAMAMILGLIAGTFAVLFYILH